MDRLTKTFENFAMQNRRHLPAAALISVLFCALLVYFACQVWGPVRMGVLFILFLLCTLQGLNGRPDRRESILCGGFCLVFCFCLQIQGVLAASLGLAFLFFWLLMAALLFPAVLGLCRFAIRCPLRPLSAPEGPVWRTWLLYTGVILVLWMPVFLCWGPVRLDVDSVQLLKQAFEGGLNDAHPISYTLLLRFILGPFYKLGMIEVGAYLFGFMQMTVIAGVLAYTLVWIRRRGGGLLWTVMGLSLFCGTTMYAFQSLVMWKDPLFNAVLALYCLFLYDTARCRGENLRRRGPAVQLAVLTLLLCFLRGNGWPIAAVVTVVLFAAFKPARRRVLTVLLPMLIAIKLITDPVYSALGLQSRLTAEAWAIPLQQLGAVAASEPEAFAEHNALSIENIIPVSALGQAYSPVTVDPIKASPDFNIGYFGSWQAKLDLLQSWLRLLPSQWRIYLRAWAAEVMGYINPRFDGGSYSFPYEDSNGAYGITSKDLVLWLTGWNGLRDELEVRATFPPPALVIFGVILCGIILALRRQTRLLLAYLPMYLVWVGLLLGAPSYIQLRYVLVFAFLLPAAVFMALAGGAKEGIDEAAVSSV